MGLKVFPNQSELARAEHASATNLRRRACAHRVLIGLHRVGPRFGGLHPIKSRFLEVKREGSVALVTQVKVRNQWGIKGEGDGYDSVQGLTDWRPHWGSI